MIKSKQRMDFNMTSNNQRNIPPKKTDSEPSKATESKSAKAPGTASPKEADARSSTKSHRRRAYLDDFRKTQNGNYQYEGSRYACELSEKEWKKKSTAMAAAGIAVLLLTIAAGCVPSVGLQGSIFVLLPYAVQLAAACSLTGMCKAFGQGISASGIRLSADSVQNFAARRSLHHGGRSVRHRRTC